LPDVKRAAWPDRRNTGAAGRPRRKFHFLPQTIAAADSVRMQLDAHRIRIGIVQKEFDFKPVLVRIGLYPQVAKAQRSSRPIHFEGISCARFCLWCKGW
jgi:hypothetical protein